MALSLRDCLHALIQSSAVNQREDLERSLALHLLNDPSAPFPSGSLDQALAVVQQRSHALRSLYPALQERCQSLLNAPVPLETAWCLWLPLCEDLRDLHTTLHRPVVQGVLGGQGTGKSTLAAMVALILGQWGYRVAQLSIDDLYKTYAERQQLQQQDPRLKWRGPPGTHDVELGLQVLQAVRSRQSPIALPRFDKSAHQGGGDRTAPEWVEAIDILVFEGWFVGVRPVDPTVFETAPPPIISESDRAFARDCNTRLQEYVPLWDYLDRLLVLCPTDYRWSQTWRRDAEHRLIATRGSGMSDREVDEFVDYFWRSLHPDLFITPLKQDAARTQRVVELNADHSICQVYQNGRV